MNERIQELKRQASMWCDQNIPGEFDENTGGYGYHWEEKFAELIVQETVKQMSDQLYWYGIEQSNNPSFYKAVQKTLEHFGVE